MRRCQNAADSKLTTHSTKCVVTLLSYLNLFPWRSAVEKVGIHSMELNICARVSAGLCCQSCV